MSSIGWSHKLSHYIGAAGVDARERPLARAVGLILEFPMLFAALWVLVMWWGKAVDPLLRGTADSYDMMLWGLFVFETGIMLLLVRHKMAYLKGNWLNLVIIVMGLPLLMGYHTHFAVLRLLRLLIVTALLVHVGGRIKNLLSRNQLGTTLLASLIVIVMAGAMISVLDPGIKSPIDGIWWAWVTVTTVGYGDIVPTSGAGKLFGSLIILMGIGLFSMITASLAAFFISRQEEEMVGEERENYRRLRDIEDRLCRLEDKIDKLVEQKR